MSPDIYARFILSHPGEDRASLDVDLRLPGRGLSAIFGPSGAGKTSLLRCIAGLNRAQGELRVRDEIWQGPGRRLPTHHRALGYVFQETSLFPHLNARDNLRYAQTRSGAIGRQWDDIIELLALSPLLDRMPSALSGGERQRVAIGRALLSRPRLLLMDEPLAGLDAARKQDILPFLERLHRELDIPILYVSHSLDEIARLADHIVVLGAGRVRQQGPAAEVLPMLIGEEDEHGGVFIEARVAERDTAWSLMRLEFDGGELWVADDDTTIIGSTCRVRIPARNVSLSLDARTRSSIQNRLPGKIEAIETRPDSPHALIRLRVGAWPLLAMATRRSAATLELHTGQMVWAQIKAVAIIR